MKRNIDNLGRIVIPAEMRKQLGIELNQELEIELISNQIIIKNPKSIRSKEEIEDAYKNIRDLAESEYTKGFEDALKFVLRKENE